MRTHQALQKKSSVKKAIAPEHALSSRPFAAQRKPQEDQRKQENKGLESTLGEFAIHNPDKGSSLPVQPKRAIARSGNQYEREGNQVANISMNAPQSSLSNGRTLIQCGKKSPADRLKELETKNLVTKVSKIQNRAIKKKPRNPGRYQIHIHGGRKYYYRTDANGRVLKIQGPLKYTTVKRTATQKVKNKRKNDASGHLIAHSFGGPPKLTENYVSMNKQINSAGGDWGKMEGYIRERLKQKNIQVWMSVLPSYPNNTMNRPDEIDVKLEFNRSPYEVHFSIPTK